MADTNTDKKAARAAFKVWWRKYWVYLMPAEKRAARAAAFEAWMHQRADGLKLAAKVCDSIADGYSGHSRIRQRVAAECADAIRRLNK